jgi:DNA repair photolyase
MCGIFNFMENIPHLSPHGRGAGFNPVNRFEKIDYERDPEYDASEDPALTTEFYKDTSKSVISYNDSPDVGFETSLNVYRGCEHGCVYCFARPTHEYLGLSSGLDFESKIFVKEDAPKLLRKELSHPKWKPQTIVLSAVTDCYQPIERKLQLTRRCLEVLRDFRNPVAIITKNRLVTRDKDILGEMAQIHASAVNVSVTTLNNEIARVMEPRASSPMHRLAAIEELSRAGIPVNVMVAPIVPGLTDHEMPAIVKAAANAGASSAGYVMLRLPFANKDLFERWCETHFPDRKDKILNRVREIRDGKLYNSKWGERMRGTGIFADHIAALFDLAVKRSGMKGRGYRLSTESFQNPNDTQMTLF